MKKDATVVERITGCACCNICTYLFFACFRRLQEDGVSVTSATSVAYHQRLMAQTDLILVLWAIGNGRLNTSPKLGAYTSIPSTPSSMAALLLTEGCLFSGKASSLDAFRSYPKQLSCLSVPCRTADKPEAALPCSSRTRGNFPSDNHAPVRQRPTCLTTV